MEGRKGGREGEGGRGEGGCEGGGEAEEARWRSASIGCEQGRLGGKAFDSVLPLLPPIETALRELTTPSTTSCADAFRGRGRPCACDFYGGYARVESRRLERRNLKDG